MPEKSGTDAPRGAADAGAAATAASAAAMHGIRLSFIAALHHVRKTMLHRSGRAFTWCSTDKFGSPHKPKRGPRLGPGKRKQIPPVLGDKQTILPAVLNDCFREERTFPSVATMGRF